MRAGFLKLEQTALRYPNQNPCRGEKLRPLAGLQRLPLLIGDVLGLWLEHPILLRA